MSKFLVDSRTLLAVRNALGRLHDQLLGVHTVVDGYQGVIGGAALEGELEQFCTHWHYGIVELGGQITSMMRRLEGAAAAYQRIEHRIVAASSGGAPVAPGAHSPVGSGTTTVGGGGSGGPGRGGAGHSGGHAGTSPTGPGRTVIGGGTDHHSGNGALHSSGHGTITVNSPLLTHGQEGFVGRLAMLTGLDPRVVGAWTLAEESSGAAEGREAEGNNNWLNIGYYDSGPGAIAFNGAFDNPDGGAERTADFLEGKWGGASPSIRSIVDTRDDSPERQIDAIANSDWASSHYGNGSELRATYRELAGIKVRTA